MQRRINLSTKLALAIGTIAVVCAISYAVLQRELDRIRVTLDHSVSASQAMTRAAYEMERVVVELAHMAERSLAGAELQAREFARMRTEFLRQARAYRDNAGDPGTRTLANTVATRFVPYVERITELSARLHAERERIPQQHEKIAELERAVAALTSDPVLMVGPSSNRAAAEQLLQLAYGMGRRMREFLRRPGPDNAWRVEQASGEFEHLLTLTLADSPPVRYPERVRDVRTRIDALRTTSRSEMYRRRELDTEVTSLAAQRDNLRGLIHTRLQSAAGAHVRLAQNLIDRRMSNARERLSLIVVLVATLAIVGCYFAVAGFLRPLSRLIAALRGVGSGRLDARLDLQRNDELGDLAVAFNDMAMRLERITVSRAYLDQILSAIAEGVFVVDAAFVVRRANHGACALAGQPAEQLLGRALAGLLRLPPRLAWPPADGRAEFECELIAADGSVHPILFTAAPLAEAGAAEFVCTTTDISLLKQAERELARSHTELREAYVALQRVQEEERARLAREVHDEFGAVLTVMNSTLHMLADTLPPAGTRPPQLLARLHELVERASAATDSIVNGLRPPILDHFGLAAALDWYVEDFEARTGLSCSIDIERLPELGTDLALAVFRVAQECLTNVARHAHAQAVALRLRLVADHLLLEIEDDGRGGLDGQRHGHGRTGLRGMDERLLSFGGSLEVLPGSPCGTLVRATLPLADQPVAASLQLASG